MKSLWRLIFPAEVQVDSTEGQQARERAETELLRVQAETPYYAGLGRDLRTLRERNHIAERIRSTLREA